MKDTEPIVREHGYQLLWGHAGRRKEVSLQFWVTAKGEFNRIEDPLWVTEEAATTRRPRNLLEDNPASG